MIELKNINKKYDNNVVFENLNVNFENNKITAIMGESGCGKTTLLNILAGLTDFEGEIINADTNVSFVFNNNRLIPNLTVKQNLELINSQADLDFFLKLAELENVKDFYPKQLSTGMAHRVSLIRAFIYPSKTLLMDEPFRSLDIVIKHKIIKLLLQLLKNDNRTVIFVSHNIEDVLEIANQIVIIKNKKCVFNETCKQKNIKSKIIKILTN